MGISMNKIFAYILIVLSVKSFAMELENTFCPDVTIKDFEDIIEMNIPFKGCSETKGNLSEWLDDEANIGKIPCDNELWENMTLFPLFLHLNAAGTSLEILYILPVEKAGEFSGPTLRLFFNNVTIDQIEPIRRLQGETHEERLERLRIWQDNYEEMLQRSALVKPARSQQIRTIFIIWNVLLYYISDMTEHRRQTLAILIFLLVCDDVLDTISAYLF